MNWRGSREADARLSAREAVKVRAALAESISSQTLYEAYLATSPNSSGNIAQDRARARAWAIINVRVNMEALKLVLIRIWTTGYLLGELSADELLDQARRAQKSAMITKKETPRAISMDIDWDSWTPGDQLTAAMLKPPKGLRRLLEGSGVTIKGINNTTLNDIGNALGEAVALGLAPKQAAKLIRQSVGSPARALSISITEMNRAVSTATIDRYRDFGLTQMRWVTFDPCDKCAMNDQEVANIGAPFPSGDTQTPAHPNCRCRLAPVIPDPQEVLDRQGGVIEPESSSSVADMTPVPMGESYRMEHRAPVRADEYGAPATNLEDVMPDFYTRPDIYTTGMPQADRESLNVLRRIKDNPDEMVTIYRAVPMGVQNINPGDWVTLSPSYAETHMVGNVQQGTVISRKIPARDLWTDGNSINEFGYDPVGKG